MPVAVPGSQASQKLTSGHESFWRHSSTSFAGKDFLVHINTHTSEETTKSHSGFSTCPRPPGPTSSHLLPVSLSQTHSSLAPRSPYLLDSSIALDLCWHPQGVPVHTCSGPRCCTMNTGVFNPWSQACGSTQILMHTEEIVPHSGRCRKVLNRINYAHEVQIMARHMYTPAN